MNTSIVAETPSHPASQARETNLTRPRKWRVLLLPAAVVMIALVAWVAFDYFSQSPYEHYVSPPLGTTGLRVEVLIPGGWEVIRDIKTQKGPWNKSFGGGHDLHFVAKDPFRSWPEWLRRILPVRQELAAAFVNVYPFTPGKSLRPENKEDIWRNDKFIGFRTWKGTLSPDGKHDVVISYQRGNETEFDRTHKVLADSLKVWIEKPAIAR